MSDKNTLPSTPDGLAATQHAGFTRHHIEGLRKVALRDKEAQIGCSTITTSELHFLCDMALLGYDDTGERTPVSESVASDDVERLKEALRQVKAFVVGERIPNWANDTTTYLTRGKISDICDFAIAHPNHPRDVHLTVEKR
jgi:hypothetical protein